MYVFVRLVLFLVRCCNSGNLIVGWLPTLSSKVHELKKDLHIYGGIVEALNFDEIALISHKIWPIMWVWIIISHLLTNVQLMPVILNRSRIARWWARVVCFSFGTRTMIMCNLNFIQWGVTDLIACYLGLRIKIELGFILLLLYDTCHSQTSHISKVITCKKIHRNSTLVIFQITFALTVSYQCIIL